MRQRDIRPHIKNGVMILLGALIFAFGINYFAIPNRLAEGGVTGITLLLKYSLNWSPALVTMVINIPLFVIGWRELGRAAMGYTIFGTTAFSLFLWLLEDIGVPIGNDMLLAALYAGACIGLGLGIIFRFGGTTGGIDIVVRVLQKHFRWPIGRTMFVCDFIVISASAYFLGREKAMYTLIAVFIASRVIDFVQEGAYAVRAALIISQKDAAIGEALTREMGRGATLLKGKGGYTGIDRDVLYCVVNRTELTRLKEIVHRIDPYAFVVVNNVHEVLGEGFSFTEEERKQMEQKNN